MIRPILLLTWSKCTEKHAEKRCNQSSHDTWFSSFIIGHRTEANGTDENTDHDTNL